MSGAIHPLKDNQVKAVDPQDSVWLSASAGTGKTQVLSARVLRLLLQRDVSPSQILCLTFTKAGAAEMATRVNDVLARWVRMKPEPLAKELQSIGASVRPEVQDRARSLFASVLDCPGGGLRIDTIHAFAQWLLGAFPEEAGLLPGTRAMEDRDRDLLTHRVLADLLVDWHRSGEEAYLDALADLSVRMGPEKAQAWLMRCAQARELWYGAGGWPDEGQSLSPVPPRQAAGPARRTGAPARGCRRCLRRPAPPGLGRELPLVRRADPRVQALPWRHLRLRDPPLGPPHPPPLLRPDERQTPERRDLGPLRMAAAELVAQSTLPPFPADKRLN